MSYFIPIFIVLIIFICSYKKIKEGFNLNTNYNIWRRMRINHALCLKRFNRRYCDKLYFRDFRYRPLGRLYRKDLSYRLFKRFHPKLNRIVYYYRKSDNSPYVLLPNYDSFYDKKVIRLGNGRRMKIRLNNDYLCSKWFQYGYLYKLNSRGKKIPIDVRLCGHKFKEFRFYFKKNLILKRYHDFINGEIINIRNKNYKLYRY